MLYIVSKSVLTYIKHQTNQRRLLHFCNFNDEDFFSYPNKEDAFSIKERFLRES